MTSTAIKKVFGCPAAREVHLAKLVKIELECIIASFLADAKVAFYIVLWELRPSS
jgi:hypothetical protein